MKNSQQGFTLIELITVIVLLGILSAFAISRFPSSQSYSTTVIKNQLIASIRLAQQTALSRASVDRSTNSSSLQTQLQITRDSDNWSLNITSGPISHNAQVKRSNETVYYGTNTSASCSALTASTSIPLTLIFDGDGNRVPATALRICINTPSSSTADVELCISPSGYVYEGICAS